MGPRRLLPLALVLLCASSAAGAAGSKPRRISWSDSTHRHGWALEPRAYRLCATKRARGPISHYRSSAICSTDDGGRTWSQILYSTRTIIRSFIRTSERTGIVAAGYWNAEEYWTRDNGRHWYLTDVARPSEFSYNPSFFRRYGRLYFRSTTYSGKFATEFHRAVFRIDGWVPKGSLDCASGRLCNSGMRAVRVGTATFDPIDGTGSLTAEDAELATGWTYAQLADRAATTTFAATFYVSWEAVCVADDTSASSTSAGTGKVRRGVLQSVSHDTSSGALTGFDLHGYSGVLDRFDVPAPGDRCRVSIDPFPAGQISKVTQTARRVWLSMADGYEIGGYAL